MFNSIHDQWKSQNYIFRVRTGKIKAFKSHGKLLFEL